MTPQWPFGRLKAAAVFAQHGMSDSAQVLVDQLRASGSRRWWTPNPDSPLGRIDGPEPQVTLKPRTAKGAFS